MSFFLLMHFFIAIDIQFHYYEITKKLKYETGGTS